VVGKLSKQTLQALQSAELRERASKMGSEAMPMTPAEFDTYIRNEIAINAALVKAAGIKIN
jgi:tripartite-type tricarboxylate transporter receptor subunit TctC